eukprot:EG_transcript_47752
MPTLNRIKIDRLMRETYARHEVRRALWNALLKDQATPRPVVAKVAQLSRELPPEERVDRKKIRRYCLLTNHPRSVNKSFGLSRHIMRDYGRVGLLPGVTKRMPWPHKPLPGTLD